ncbi:hypothetical protein TNCV_4444791 [Trichonephila clavipes]|nr:hypothetical protein TNCV_4444791 [Trichonephila clavipes]
MPCGDVLCLKRDAHEWPCSEKYSLGYSKILDLRTISADGVRSGIIWRYFHTFEISSAESCYCRRQISGAIELRDSRFYETLVIEILRLATAFASSEVTVES